MEENTIKEHVSADNCLSNDNACSNNSTKEKHSTLAYNKLCQSATNEYKALKEEEEETRKDDARDVNEMGE